MPQIWNAVHETNHQRYFRGVQKAMAYREQLQIS